MGAQPTEAVEQLLKITGDWQKFKGEAAPAPMQVKEPKADKRAAFEAAAREGLEGGGGAATTPKKKAAPPGIGVGALPRWKLSANGLRICEKLGKSLT